MKKLLTIIALFAGICAFAQQPMSEAESKAAEQKIAAASAAIKTLSCDFEQQKNVSILSSVMTSKGKLYYSREARLRWQYQSPYSYTFLMNGDKVKIINEKSSNTIDTKSNRMFKSISQIIVSGVNGSGVTNTRDFAIKFFNYDSHLTVEMIPTDKTLKGMFSKIRLNFSTQDYTVDSVELHESSGDVTRITMKNKQINKPIDEKIFAVD